MSETTTEPTTTAAPATKPKLWTNDPDLQNQETGVNTERGNEEMAKTAALKKEKAVKTPKVKKAAAPKLKSVKTPKAPKAEKAPKVVREIQNGFCRPHEGSKTGIVWDIADKISQKLKRPAFRSEVFEEYLKGKGTSAATAGTQYSRWCAFHDVASVLKKFKTEDREAKDEAKAKEKADRKAEAAKKKAGKKKVA